MKPLLLSLLVSSSLFAEFSVQGEVAIDVDQFLLSPKDKHKNAFTTTQRVELTYEKESLKLYANLYSQQAYFDLLEEEAQTERTFARLDEFYLNYEFDNALIEVGKTIKFWGALEVNNIVDGFNVRDFRNDSFSNDKLGVYNISATTYTDSGEISIIVKFDEANQAMASYPYVYYFFPKTIGSIPIEYNENLKTENSKNEPTLYFTYSGSTDSEYPLDYAVIIQHGYDSQRYIAPDSSDKTPPIALHENAYRVNKIMTYNTLVVGSTLFKLEALYTDVINEKKVSDYYQIAPGIEHTFSGLIGENDLGLIAEYYMYENMDEGEEIFSVEELFQLFQNDLFLGIRYSFNDASDSSIVGGVIQDLEYDEQSYYIEYSTRVADTFTLDLDYRYIEPSAQTLEFPTAYQFLGRLEKIGVNIGYHF